MAGYVGNSIGGLHSFLRIALRIKQQLYSAIFDALAEQHRRLNLFNTGPSTSRGVTSASNMSMPDKSAKLLSWTCVMEGQFCFRVRVKGRNSGFHLLFHLSVPAEISGVNPKKTFNISGCCQTKFISH